MFEGDFLLECQRSSLSRSCLAAAKCAFNTRRVPAEAMVSLLTGAIEPQVGDLVLARVVSIGQHTRIQTPEGRRARPYKGDEIIVCYDHRYAANQFEALVPDRLECCQLVASGSIAAKVKSNHSKMKRATEIKPLGLIGNVEGRPVNISAWALPHRPARLDAPCLVNSLVVAAGDAMGAKAAVDWLKRYSVSPAALFGAWLRFDERVQSERLGQDFVHRIRVRLFRHLEKVSPRVRESRAQGGVMLRFVNDLTAPAPMGIAGLGKTGGCGRGVVWNVAGFVRDQLVLGVDDQCGPCCGGRGDPGPWQIGALRGVTQATIGLASAGTLLLGVVQVSLGSATPGAVVAAMSIVGFMLLPLRHLGRVYEYWQSARVSQYKISQILALPHMSSRVQQSKHLKRCAPGVEFRQVSVPGVLNRFSATAQPGRRIAIVGPNGSGKSTLFGLIMRLVDPEAGKVFLDGKDIAHIRRSSLLKAIGIMSADVPLLRGTIRSNLCYRNPDASQEEVERVCRLTGVDKILAGLALGDQTRLIGRGLNLSLGERQRLALARALVGTP